MRRVFLASPFAGEMDKNRVYAEACLADCCSRGEAAYVPHLLYPRVLDDSNPADRAFGMDAGKSFMSLVDALVVYEDRGISSGMESEIKHARYYAIPIERRHLGLTWKEEADDWAED